MKAPIDELGLSNGARSGLTGFVAGLARQTARHNVTINNLLPGAFDTDRLRANLEFNAEEDGKTDAELAQGAHRRQSRPGASAPPTSSAPPAPSCAACRRATSPARTCCSTAAPTRARSKIHPQEET